MTESISSVKAPFQNLKFLVIINKLMGLISCKLEKGRLRPSSIWTRRFCLFWILFHCAYTFMNYYKWCTQSDIETHFFLNIIRLNFFFVSLLPYHYVAAFRSRDVVKSCKIWIQQL
ncbi:uncharacterized protein LOC116847610 [Odontomachus brunneus]|uniref:uncharacterized protein LOC116847610 n=1 Tax=Odontomachus brunneus TaxID=486640 RepID=UPI0013F2135C|nr:uncharacterized protein LOC116847610 [Odontomachus brunneus]